MKSVKWVKCSLSGNTWSGSSWDGKSKYTKKTQEQNPDGSMVTITADFRKYPCIEDSIADHSAYLLGAMNGKKLRYDGLKGCTDYKKAVQIIKDGGYATSLTYVEKLISIIEKWNRMDLVGFCPQDLKNNGWWRLSSLLAVIFLFSLDKIIKFNTICISIRYKYRKGE